MTTSTSPLRKRSRLRMIPVHATCLPARDYVPYLFSILLRRRHQRLSLAEIWAPWLARRSLYPTPTGRHALWYFLDRVQLQPGDEVLISAYNYYVVVRLIIQKGLTPVFVDIDPETLCMDKSDLARKITRRSKMVVLTHMFGNPADLDQIAHLCEKRGLLLFEDCAHAVGSTFHGQQVGQHGDGALFSFEVTKLMTSFGGGMLALSDVLAESYEIPRNRTPLLQSILNTATRCVVSMLTSPPVYGWTLHPLKRFARALADRGIPGPRNVIAPSKDDFFYRFHENSRAPAKAFMRQMYVLQLKRLGDHVRRRRAIMSTIKSRLLPIPAIQLLNEDKHGLTNASYLGIYVPEKHALAGYLAEWGVSTNPQEYFDCSALMQFAEFAADCPHARHASERILRLPSYPTLRDEEVDYIATVIESFYANVSSRAEGRFRKTQQGV